MNRMGKFIVEFDAIAPIEGGMRFEEFLGALFTVVEECRLPHVTAIHHIRRDETARVVVEEEYW